ncbi:16S rRNA (guanine(527)-N(7))-methyltransferase RsmG [Candidatus Dependentiae bacterium]|nr:16S rRNA (guanine(527)-N(7))-methyltransferase RsmG [Candidatus Dependentiae bacterium]
MVGYQEVVEQIIIEYMNTAQAWQLVQQDCQLTALQVEQCQRYLALLLARNQQDNLTAIVDETQAVMDHIYDSLLPATLVPFAQGRGIVDIGSGGGLPGIPLAIKFPTIPVVLLEVIGKKVNFLQEVVATLALHNVTVVQMDWRTFTKKTQYPASYCCARASLQTDELLRMFGGASNYRTATLVYWASATYDVALLHGYDYTERRYTVGPKERRLLTVPAPQHKVSNE